MKTLFHVEIGVRQEFGYSSALSTLLSIDVEPEDMIGHERKIFTALLGVFEEHTRNAQSMILWEYSCGFFKRELDWEWRVVLLLTSFVDESHGALEGDPYLNLDHLKLHFVAVSFLVGQHF